VAVKTALNTALESTAVERQRMVDWLQQQLSEGAEQLRIARVEGEQYRSTIDACERRLEQERLRAERAEELARTIQAHLDAERSRRSYRAMSWMLATWRAVPGFGFVLRRLTRSADQPMRT
jgi:hypothetical protein